MAALAVYRPNAPGFAMGVPLPMWAVLVIYAFIDFAGLTGATNVAHEAHLLGIIAGGYFGYAMRRQKSREQESEDEKEEIDNWQQRIREWEEKYMLDKGD